MKKFYLLLVVLCAALSMNAAVEKLYMIDNIDGNSDSDWNISTGREMTKIADGVFELKNVNVAASDKYFSFVISPNSDWNEVNKTGNRYCPPKTENNTYVKDGNEYNMMAENDYSWRLNAGIYDFTVNTNTMKLSVACTEAPRTDKWKLSGNLVGDWTDYDMTHVGSNVWNVTLNVAKSGDDTHFALQYFASANASAVWYGGASGWSDVVLDTPMGVVKDNKEDFKFKLTTGEYIFSLNANDMKLTVTKKSEVTPSDVVLYSLHGNVFTGAATAFEDRDLTLVDGKWVGTLNFRYNGDDASFGIRQYIDEDKVGTPYWCVPAGNSAVVLGTPMNYKREASLNSGAQFSFAGIARGRYDVTVDPEASTITMTPAEEENNVRWAIRSNIFSEDGAEGEVDIELVNGVWQYQGEPQRNGEILVVGYDEAGNATIYGCPKGKEVENTYVNVPLNLSVSYTTYKFNRFVETGDLANNKEFRFIFNPEDLTIMLLRVGAPMYLVGTIKEARWDIQNPACTMTNVAGTNRYHSEEFVTFNGFAGGNAYFCFTSILSPRQQNDADENDLQNLFKEYTNIGRFSPGVGDIDVTDKDSYQILYNSNDKSFSVASGTSMRMVIDLDTRRAEFYKAKNLIPDKIYLHGDLWGHHFDWNGPDSATAQYDNEGNASYEFIGMLIEDHGDGKGYFVLSDWHKSAGAQSVRARVAAEGEAAGLTDEVAANGHAYTKNSSVLLKNTYGDTDGLVEVTPNKYYDIKLTLSKEGTVSALEAVERTDLTTGVEAVDVEDMNVPVEYYNMQGVRVANPENGVYIRRQGNRVTKVVL